MNYKALFISNTGMRVQVRFESHRDFSEYSYLILLVGNTIVLEVASIPDDKIDSFLVMLEKYARDNYME